jgi:hypothetical protein
VGTSRAERLDPFALPLRFVDAAFACVDEQVAMSNSTASVWSWSRAIRIKMAVNLPVAAYLGVAIRMGPQHRLRLPRLPLCRAP